MNVRGEPAAVEAAGSVARFESWFEEVEPSLRGALVATFGADLGREAAAEALTYAWEHRDRVLAMDNPVGFVFRVGQRWAARQRRRSRRRVGLPVGEEPPVGFDPTLDAALASLPLRQRQVAVLCLGYGLTHREAAELLGVSPSTVQNHVERGLAQLRKQVGP